MMTVPAGASGETMREGRDYCLGCDADVLPSGPRQNEGHIAARFGRDDRRHFDVFEGDAKHLRTYEVQAGPGGWVIETRGIACPACISHMLVQLRYGDDFRIERIHPAGVA